MEQNTLNSNNIDAENKIASFRVKQSMPYEFKVNYARIRAWEFYNECGKRDLDCYVSVGGLDSITLFFFLKSIGINVPAVSVSSLEDVSIQKIHKQIGVISLPPAVRDDGTRWNKQKLIQEFGFPVLSKEIARKIELLQNPTPNNKTVRHAIVTGEDGKAYSKELFFGKYTVKEIKQPAGYVFSEEEWNVELSYKDQETEIVTEYVGVENTPSKFVLVKTEAGSEQHLSGVKFAFWEKTELLTEDAPEPLTDEAATGGLLTVEMPADEPEKEILTTGEDGTLTVEKLVPGTYCIQEVETVPGYLMDGTVYEFTVSEDGRINGEEIGFLTVENAATGIARTKAVNSTRLHITRWCG